MINMKSRKLNVRLLMFMLLVTGAMLLSSCEQFFTSNLLSSLRRDPSKMSSAQKTEYAKQALDSGDPATMKTAFEALTSGNTSNLTTDQKLLAVQLGVGASGIKSTATQVAAQYSAGDDPYQAIDDAAANVDPSLVDETATILNSLPQDSGATADDYALTAVALGLVAVKDTPGGAANLTGTEPEIVQAKTYFDTAQAMLQASGQSSDIVNGIADYFKA